MTRLQLPGVTLCAATSVNVAATVSALQQSLDRADFADCLFFTEADLPNIDRRITIIRIAPFSSAADYSEFILTELGRFITTDHCLVVQWDGFVLDPGQWDPAFLQFDYVGAPWPQFDDGHDVGNGGFSLRSRKLLGACLDPRFARSHPEDLAICRVNRNLLEQKHGIRFADRGTAKRFSCERTSSREPTFGFHGIFNMIRLLGPDRFWQVYQSLDHKGSAFVDYLPLFRQLGAGKEPSRRRVRLSMDYLAALAKR